MRFYQIALPIPEGGTCLEQAIRLVLRHPGWTLHKGPAEPKHLFWKDDTAHFWAIDEKGNVHDPTAYRYPDYDYSKGNPCKFRVRKKCKSIG